MIYAAGNICGNKKMKYKISNTILITEKTILGILLSSDLIVSTIDKIQIPTGIIKINKN